MACFLAIKQRYSQRVYKCDKSFTFTTGFTHFYFYCVTMLSNYIIIKLRDVQQQPTLIKKNQSLIMF